MNRSVGWMTAAVPASLLALSISACGGTADGAAGGGPGGATRTVTVRNVTTYWTSAGSTDVQNETRQFAAVLGSGANLTRIAATQPAPGVATYVIRGVPPGSFWLESRTGATGAPTFVESSEDLVDVGGPVWGRADATIPTSPTPITFTFTNLSPWQTDMDSISFFSADAGVVSTAFGSGSSRPDPWGAAFLATTATGSYTYQRLPLVEPSRGDTTWFVQLATRIILPSGEPVQAADRYYMSSTFGISPGVARSFDVPFATPSSFASVPLDFRAAEFFSRRSELSPDAGTPTGSVAVRAYPAFSPRSVNSRSGWVELLRYTASHPFLDVDLGMVPYAQFLPAPWTTMRVATYGAWRDYYLPGTDVPASQWLAMVSYEALPDASTVIRPALSPARSLALGGSPAYASRSGVGVTPTLSWSPPAVMPAGMPIVYSVYLYRLGTSLPYTTKTAVGTFQNLSGTSLAIPAGILTAGEPHYAAVLAYTAGGAWTPYHGAWTSTGIFTP